MNNPIFINQIYPPDELCPVCGAYWRCDCFRPDDRVTLTEPGTRDANSELEAAVESVRLERLRDAADKVWSREQSRYWGNV